MIRKGYPDLGPHFGDGAGRCFVHQMQFEPLNTLRRHSKCLGPPHAVGEINEATVRQLHGCEFRGGALDVVLIGGSGTGKTHVATALGVQVVEHHRCKVRFFSTIERVNTLEQEKAKGKAGQLAESLVRLGSRDPRRT